MSRSALAYSMSRSNRRRRSAMTHARPPKQRPPWHEVQIKGASVVAAPQPMFVPRYTLAIAALVVLVHIAIVTRFKDSASHAAPDLRKSELNIELVRPPKPVEPPKVEPERTKPRKAPVTAAPTVPPIQQSEALPSIISESAEAPVAVATAVTGAPTVAAESATLPTGHAGYLNNPPPRYPAQAIKQGWQGTVLLHVHVLTTGKVDVVEVQESSGRKVLDDEAIRTVKQWLFAPAKRGATPVEGWATVPIEFLLDQ